MSELGERVMALEVRVQRMETIERRLARLEINQAKWFGGMMVFQFLITLGLGVWLKLH